MKLAKMSRTVLVQLVRELSVEAASHDAQARAAEVVVREQQAVRDHHEERSLQIRMALDDLRDELGHRDSGRTKP